MMLTKKLKGKEKNKGHRGRLHDDDDDDEGEDVEGAYGGGVTVRSSLYGYETDLRTELDDTRLSSKGSYQPRRPQENDMFGRRPVVEGYYRRLAYGDCDDTRMGQGAQRYQSISSYQPRRPQENDMFGRRPVVEGYYRRLAYGDCDDTRMGQGAQRYQSISSYQPRRPQENDMFGRRPVVEGYYRRLAYGDCDDTRMGQGAQRYQSISSGQSASGWNMTSTTNKIVVAAIDFGTTYSGYAFSFKHDYDTNPLKMHANAWTNVAQGNMNAKTPTCLLLDPSRKLHSFGNEAKTKYASLAEENEHRDWYFFREFKMTLHQKREITGNYLLTEENGKKLDALTVFSLSIQALKNHLMTVLHNGFPGVKDSDVMWVITVPAIWNDSAKKFMRVAAEQVNDSKQAGIQADSIDIALEPEAASLFCRQLPITRDPQIETGMTKFPAGTRYMILDCGGGTVDVTVHEVLEDNNLKELHKATGGSWGGTNVNKEFLKFVANFVGSDVFDEFSKNHKSDYFEMLEEFENKKRMTSADSTEKVTIRLPITLQTLFQDASNRPLSEQAEQSRYQNRLTIFGDKLRIDSKLFKSFFSQAVWDITVHVGDLLDSLPRPVKAILMVGGFSESQILQRSIKNSFGDRVEVIVPPEASLCVMKGAVLYGHQPSKITERKSRYTYGVAMTVPFNKGEYPRDRKIISDGEEWCDKVFDKHVEIGQTVKTDEAQATRTYYPMSTSDTFLPVYIFRSTDRNPKFVDEHSCDFVGLFRVTREPGTGKTTKKDAIKVRLIFGGSDIKVETFRTVGRVQRAKFTINV